MLASPSFLALIVIPSARPPCRGRCPGSIAVGLAGFAGLDEPGVLGEPAGVEEERLAVPVADGADGAEVLERDRLAAARVVRHGHEDDRHVARRARPAARSSASMSMLPLNGWSAAGSRPSAMTRSTRLGAGRLDVGPRRVEVGVVRDDLARPADDREQDLLGGAALVGRDDVAERPELRTASRNVNHDGEPGVRLVAVLDARPTGRGSSRRSRSRSAGR